MSDPGKGDIRPPASTASRYTDLPFPAYRHLPGRTPHPRRDPSGHHFGIPEIGSGPLEPELWWECGPYLYGVDLYNFAYFWEAHESWEAVWKASAGLTATFLQGLIQVSAALLKKRLQAVRGMENLWRHGSEKLRAVRASSPCYGGIELGDYLERMGAVFRPEDAGSWATDARIFLHRGAAGDDRPGGASL